MTKSTVPLLATINFNSKYNLVVLKAYKLKIRLVILLWTIARKVKRMPRF